MAWHSNSHRPGKFSEFQLISSSTWKYMSISKSVITWTINMPFCLCRILISLINLITSTELIVFKHNLNLWDTCFNETHFIKYKFKKNVVALFRLIFQTRIQHPSSWPKLDWFLWRLFWFLSPNLLLWCRYLKARPLYQWKFWFFIYNLV